MTDSDRQSARHPAEKRIIFALVAGSLVIGAVSAWLSRSEMNADGISYLDLSDHWMAGDYRGIVNGYWSSMYPALLAAVRAILRPSAALEFRAVHVANYVAFVIGLITFSLFINELSSRSPWPPARRTAIAMWGYALFLWSSITQVELAIVTPDLLLSALIWLIAFLVLKAADDRPLASLTLGAACAIAYLTKSVMFVASEIGRASCRERV